MICNGTAFEWEHYCFTLGPDGDMWHLYAGLVLFMWLKGFQFHFTARSLQKTPINLQIPFAHKTASFQCLASGSAQHLIPKQSLTAITIPGLGYKVNFPLLFREIFSFFMRTSNLYFIFHGWVLMTYWSSKIIHPIFFSSRLQRKLTDLSFKSEISAQQASAGIYCAFPSPYPILPMQFN